MGSALLTGTEAHHSPTGGSNKARRHMSTSGKSCVTGNASTSVTVTSAQRIKRPDVAGSVFVAPVANRALRYDPTLSVMVCLSCGCDAEGQLSMKDTSLDKTVSRTGTCVKRIGLSARDSMPGRNKVV